MSHKNHTNHVNYSKISTTVEPTPAVVDTTPEVDITPPAPPEPVDGFVSGCKRLNVRKEPVLYGEIICEVSEGTTLMIDRTESTDEWYKVYTEAGAEGYCMKKFVTIKQ